MENPAEEIRTGDDQARSEAARKMGSARTPAKAATSRENGRLNTKSYERTPEILAKQRESLKRAWDRRRAAKAANEEI